MSKQKELAFFRDSAAGFKTTTKLTLGIYTHVAVTHDGSQLKFYINGVMDESWVAHFVTVMGPESPVRQASAAVETTLMEVGTFVGDEFVNPSEPGQLLFEGHTDGHKPVLAPPYDVSDDQRQQLTLDDFDNVSGTMQIQELMEGTRVTFEFTGLIPGGVYTLWADYYAAPGLTDDFAHGQALGALGAADGSENTFTAAEDGTITFATVMPAGPLSWFTIEAC